VYIYIILKLKGSKIRMSYFALNQQTANSPLHSQLDVDQGKESTRPIYIQCV